MSLKSVRQQYPTRVSYKSDPQECPTRVSYKSVPEECPTSVSHKSVIWTYVVFRMCLHSGSWVPSCFFFDCSLAIPGIAHVRNALDERTVFLCCCKMVWGGSVSARILRDVGEGAQTWKGAKRLGQAVSYTHLTLPTKLEV